MPETPIFRVVTQADGDDIIIPLPPEIVEALQIDENHKFELLIEGDQLRLIPLKTK